MSDKHQRPAPAAPATSEQIGGASIADEMLRPVVSSALSSVLDWVLDAKPINEALKYLSPSVRQFSSLLPMAVAGGFAKLPVTMFGNATYAHFFQDVVVEMARHVDRKIKATGSVDKVSTEEYAAALHEGAQAAVEAKKYVMDHDRRHLHVATCLHVLRHRSPQEQRKDRNGQPIPSKPVPLTPVSIAEALEMKLKACPDCIESLQAEAKKAEAPKPAKAPRSPMDVIGGSGDPELQGKFNAWFKGLTAAERERVLKLLRHLDSVDEFKGLMATDPEIRDEMLTLLENTNASYTVGKVLEAIGKAGKTAGTEIAEGFKVAYLEFKAWEESLAPLEQRLEARLKAPAKRRPWYDMFKVW